MRDLKPLFIFLLPITFFYFDIPPAKAACANLHAVGWYRYTNKEVGQITNKIKGMAWDCSTAYWTGKGFKSNEFSASWSRCIHEESCGKYYLPKGSWIYGSFEDSTSMGLYRLTQIGLLSQKLHMNCVQQEDSNIEYCWTYE